MTRTEIEALLTKKLAPYYKRTDIRVEIKASTKDYFIFGEVAAPGVRTHPGDLTVFEAVMQAKPDDHKANIARVRVIRADPIDPLIITVNVAALLRSGDSTYNILVQENDIIVVPPTLLAQFGYFLTDLITPLTEVIQAITSAFRLPGRRFGNGFNNNVVF
jgi:protein involved in polysaccharide export with SLBB domain